MLGDGALVVVHSTLTNRRSRAWLERLRRGDASRGGPSLSVLEPHKLWQNSFTVLQKRGDGWAEPVLTQNP